MFDYRNRVPEVCRPIAAQRDALLAEVRARREKDPIDLLHGPNMHELSEAMSEVDRLNILGVVVHESGKRLV